jgi:hypothetical protein
MSGLYKISEKSSGLENIFDISLNSIQNLLDEFKQSDDRNIAIKVDKEINVVNSMIKNIYKHYGFETISISQYLPHTGNSHYTILIKKPSKWNTNLLKIFHIK